MTEQTAKVAIVLYPVDDVGRAVDFYRDVIGLALLFTDGDRFAMLGGPDAMLALAGRGEQVCADRVAASIKVGSVSAVLERAARAGVEVIVAAERGPHEIRAVLADIDRNPLVVYQPAD